MMTKSICWVFTNSLTFTWTWSCLAYLEPRRKKTCCCRSDSIYSPLHEPFLLAGRLCWNSGSCRGRTRRMWSVPSWTESGPLPPPYLITCEESCSYDKQRRLWSFDFISTKYKKFLSITNGRFSRLTSKGVSIICTRRLQTWKVGNSQRKTPTGFHKREISELSWSVILKIT